MEQSDLNPYCLHASLDYSVVKEKKMQTTFSVEFAGGSYNLTNSSGHMETGPLYNSDCLKR